MFSPHERVYNTPDVSVPAAEALLQQIRLERVLKRFGYFACCKPIKTRDDSIAPPLVTLGPPAPTRTLRPFGAHEAFTGWQRSKNIQIPKPKICKVSTHNKHTETGCQRLKKLNAGHCNNAEVQLQKQDKNDSQRTDLFKPFQPLKSPQRLPTIQRERNREKTVDCPEFKIQDTVELSKKKQRNTELRKLPAKAVRKKRKTRRMEVEFMKWEASNEEYFAKSVSDLHDYVSNKEKNHVHTGNEQKYREQIETQIKRGVQQRVESFGQSGNYFAKSKPQANFIPVLELEIQPTKVPGNITRR